jgi:hypothetical protein
MSKKAPAERAPELAALLASDRIALATEAFVRTFTPHLDEPYPITQGLPHTVAEIGSVPLSSWTWHTSRPNDGAIARLVLELVLIWERAGIAARGVFNDSSEIALLFRGEELLRTADPRLAVEEEIRASTDRV